MIPYQLSTGKTIYISFEDWLNINDEKIQEYVARNHGIDINDPFADIHFKENSQKPFDIPEIEEYIEPLNLDDIEDIKKEINDSD